MGLLEKAVQKKEQTIDRLEEDIDEIQSRKDLLEKNVDKKDQYLEGLDEEHNKKIIEEKKGFGWKGLGIRRITFDETTSEYYYEVVEPELTAHEKEIKKELTHLFKMLADVNVTGLKKEEKKKYLEETLEQIIIDNDITFSPEKPKENKEKRHIKNIISILSKKRTNEKQSKDKHSKFLNLKEKFSINNILYGKKERKNREKELLDKSAQESKDKIFYHLFRDFIGYGRIDILMEDDGIEDISCDGPGIPVFLYHKKYEEMTTNIVFEDDAELDSFVVRLSQICGKQISIYSPIVDGKLPDGSRLQAMLSKTVTEGSTFTIRRFRENPLTPIDLIQYKSLSIDMAAYFWMAIENGASILFCGGTASGKTTALNALSLFIPSAHKIISIEDTREVNLPHKNWIAGTTRQGFSSSAETKTEKDIDMFDLIRAALRQRPKVIIVGEVRGREAYSLFQAMATGHTSYATVHASTIHTLIQRLENPPISLPRALLTSLDIIVFQNAVDIGKKTVRRMTSVTEVIKLDPDTNQLIFMEPFRWVSKTDDRFESSGGSKILNTIRIQNDWTEEQLQQELENRKTVLRWMIETNRRDYREVGRIVAEYEKHPERVLEKARRELGL